MRYVLRMFLIVGGILGVWRLVVRAQKRPQTPSATSLIIHNDAVDRVLGFNSIANLRDIGGYRTSDGRTVKRGVLYRSAALSYVSDKEAQKFDELGIKLVCDLRTPEEIEAAPDKLPFRATYWHVPMLQLGNRWSELTKMLFVPHYLDGLTAQLYLGMIQNQTDNFAQIYRRLADQENLPTLVHCTAGKDRTGVTVALLLRVLGVSEADVLADYSQTNYFFDYIMNVSADLVKGLGRMGLRSQDVEPLFLADPKNLKVALDYITKTYGTVEGYFLQGLRLEPEILEALRRHFLD